MATRLSTSALRRIGQAVRTVEAGRGKGARTISAAPAWTLRMAKVASVVNGSPTSGNPYTYLADIYAGSWNDTPAARTALVEDAELWSRTALAVNDWVSVIRVGAHWEVFGGTGGTVYSRAADPTSAVTLGQTTEGTSANVITTPFAPLSTSQTGDGVSVWVCTRLRYSESDSPPKLYAYMSKLTFPKNIAPTVTGQTQVEIETPEAL